jgi:hypothetical protein
MENEDKVFEATNSDVDTDDTSTDTFSDDNEQDVETLRAELEKERTARQQITARAKKAEDQLREFKKPRSESEAPRQDTPDVDERILRANGMPDELLKELKAIATARGIDLISAQNDKLFKLAKEDFEREAKQKEASLGSSKGSGNSQAKKSISSPGLSKEEHKAMWKQKNS